MKKFLAAVLVIAAIVATIVTVSKLNNNAQADTEYLRIHVRANSNSATDQEIKYIVKDEVVKFITPHAAQCVDKQTAIGVIGGILDKIGRASCRERVYHDV